MIDGWKYYTHCAIPTTAPTQPVDLSPIEDGRIWTQLTKKPRPVWFARWTSDWDCGFETDWWYLILDGPYDFAALSKKSRYNVQKSLKNCEVKLLTPEECEKYADDLWRVCNEAAARYANFKITVSKEKFVADTISNAKKEVGPKTEYWAGFERETGEMIGYKVCRVYDDCVTFVSSNYSAQKLKLRVSDALNHEVLAHYLTEGGLKCAINGERSIDHVTNVQDYYRERFQFRKAYCRLNLRYKFPFGLVVRAARVLNLLPNGLRKKIDRGALHRAFSIVKMDKIARTFPAQRDANAPTR